MTFFNIALGAGPILSGLWIAVLAMFPFGVCLGTASLISVIRTKKNRIPFTFQLLILMLVLYILAAFAGAFYAEIQSLEIFRNKGGGQHVSNLALYISNTLYLPAMALFGSLPFFFFIFISTMIFHFRKFPNQEEESPQEQNGGSEK